MKLTEQRVFIERTLYPGSEVSVKEGGGCEWVREQLSLCVDRADGNLDQFG